MHRDNLVEADVVPVVRDPRKVRRRNVMFAVLGAFVLLAALAAGIDWLVWARYTESTDNAYVTGNIVRIAARAPGVVRDVAVIDTECVKAGQTLVRLDPTDAQIALERARANLVQAVRQNRQSGFTNAMNEDAVRARTVDLDLAKQALKARSNAPADIVSGEEFAKAQANVSLAQANLAAAQNQLAAGRALAGGGNNQGSAAPGAEASPAVADAAQQFRLAYVNLAHTTIAAPVAGCVTQRSVQIGQPVASGAQLMAVVPPSQLWIEANFKEAQIRHVRIGQPVEMTADLYGSDVVFHGRVDGLAPGTGSVFSMLPPQNAAGNWIKVVQRLPVTISLDPAETAVHPLPLGVSMNVSIDTHDRNGNIASAAARPRAGSSPVVDDAAMQQADAAVSAVLNGQ
ncbi:MULTISPECIES: HlyD family efflux transporter periplasmic adaptor subunit [Paraburkholderia]|uniref:HlyD family efflux transporter periplasmic adaptor subunit n=1 Tax=Paraburkholderia TaxID=1822464 RepID=UPI0022588CE9|nr:MULTISPECIES: HlyD family efflux transporter periplasmic adaptor subunit [Paraburkholderia]MCX4161708.1 efflux RND transporter periplasmic adaptor subunit [Paraburkholderia megapolitana]MDN7157205.1 efflux RND transporter periplasmic adaptor subunit [Paraburkholderia sp. CHISQ3]MDQ6494250.1 efflux RND transporter periplasmic adaptor subunit [Paraburkholderia megapolitana]